MDYRKLIEEPGHAFLYLDPPYYDQGGKLYQHAFGEQQHIEMRDLLRDTQHKWVLSYDDCPEVMALYDGWSNVARIDGVNYSITAVRDVNGNTQSRTKSELLITNL
jgi:DNA adenine methylase